MYVWDANLKCFKCVTILFPFDACTNDACQIFVLILVSKSGIRFGLLMYFVVHSKEFISGRLVNTCSTGCNSCKCQIDTLLTFPKWSWASKAFSKVFLQIWKLGLYFGVESNFGVWYLIEPCHLFMPLFITQVCKFW